MYVPSDTRGTERGSLLFQNGRILVNNILNIVNGKYESRETVSMIDKKLSDSLISNYKINLIN